jgi:hypothetical protein
MMIPKIYPYKLGSKSAKALALALNAKRVRSNGRYRPKENHLIINWGMSTQPNWDVRYTQTLNHTVNVRKASNKRYTFDQFLLHGVPHPDWTDDTECAQSWIDDGHIVYGRQTLTSHSGQGIILFDSETICSTMECPLYTKNTKAKHEYRIHVGDNGETIIDFVQKKKRIGFENSLSGIRSHSNGWIFAREGVMPPDCVFDAAKAAIKALNLDFGAADVGYNQRENKAYVYEVNTAPGLEGTTLLKYKEYFERKLT